MRNLNADEMDILDDNGESEEGAIGIEITIQELADMEAGTCCGKTGNTCFKALASHRYGHRKCRGWLLKEPAKMALHNFLDSWKNDPEAMKKKRYIEIRTRLESDLLDPSENRPQILGMFHIKIQTDKTANKISKIAEDSRGSLRFEGDSEWDGFKVFEIE